MRPNTWWHQKLPPVLGVFYATAYRSETALVDLMIPLLALLGSLAVGAAFVSLINDYTDRADDHAAGKANRLDDLSPSVALLLVATTITAGLGFLWQFSDRPWLAATYLAAWVVFMLYSLPPIRLKARGLAGVLADATGAHLLPTLLALQLVWPPAMLIADPLWTGTVLTWSLAYGLRGILSHQLLDLANDRAVALGTFAVRFGELRIRRVVRGLLFPIEFTALIVIAIQVGIAAGLLPLTLYAFFILAKTERFEQHPILVAPAPRSVIVLGEYYELFLPLAVLMAAVVAHYADVWVLAAHGLLFWRCYARLVHDLIRLPRFILG
ncbi:hypothetical protein FSZ31_06510 [Sphingorhabdus soli]|uniref:Prenyltransferase n=1 Tax=Flavisphingopyxis soli TaxID=2601267 RepID=A0A5C6UME6_9SPHN|nr:UbiA family prenyltransferase [Sphingorhabdus soli]TXC74343.1 hypothetical protein FSZ31_06510 [Sphingorhabdus soli]